VIGQLGLPRSRIAAQASLAAPLLPAEPHNPQSLVLAVIGRLAQRIHLTCTKIRKGKKWTGRCQPETLPFVMKHHRINEHPTKILCVSKFWGLRNPKNPSVSWFKKKHTHHFDLFAMLIS